MSLQVVPRRLQHHISYAAQPLRHKLRRPFVATAGIHVYVDSVVKRPLKSFKARNLSKRKVTTDLSSLVSVFKTTGLSVESFVRGCHETGL